MLTCPVRIVVPARVAQKPGFAHAGHRHAIRVLHRFGQSSQFRHVVRLLGATPLPVQHRLAHQQQVKATFQVAGPVPVQLVQCPRAQLYCVLVGVQRLGLPGGLGQIIDRLRIARLLIVMGHLFGDGLRVRPV